MSFESALSQVSGGEGKDDEEPINVFEKKNDIFNKTVDSRKYNVGDGKFSVYGHGFSGGIVDGETGNYITEAEDFEKMMIRENPRWEEALKNNEKIILSLWSCSSANLDAKGGPSLAQKISEYYKDKNVTVIGAHGFVDFTPTGGKLGVKGINTVLHSGNKLGQLVTYEKGAEVSRVAFSKLLTIIKSRK